MQSHDVEGRHAIVCGPPTSATYLATDLCRELLIRAFGSCDVVTVNSMAAGPVPEPDEGAVLLLADNPDAEASTFLAKTGYSTIVIQQDFTEACLDFAAARGASAIDSVRTMINVRAGLSSLSVSTSACPILYDPQQSVGILAEQIATALSTAPQIVADIAKERDFSTSAAAAAMEISPRIDAAPDDALVAMADALQAFYLPDPSATGTTLSVPMQLILDAKPPHGPVAGVIDLVGPTRMLTFGPYLSLPQGKWTARFEFQTGENISANSFEFDVFSNGGAVAKSKIKLQEEGHFAIEVPFELAEDSPSVEMRTHVAVGAIFGWFKLIGIEIRRDLKA